MHSIRCRAMPLGVMGGVSSEETQLLGGGMAMYGETTVDTSIFGDDLGDPTSCSAAFFGLSTGPLPLIFSRQIVIPVQNVTTHLVPTASGKSIGHPHVMRVRQRTPACHVVSHDPTSIYITILLQLHAPRPADRTLTVSKAGLRPGLPAREYRKET